MLFVGQEGCPEIIRLHFVLVYFLKNIPLHISYVHQRLLECFAKTNALLS